MVMAASKKKDIIDAERLALRLTPELKQQIERAAALRGETVSGWVLRTYVRMICRQSC